MNQESERSSQDLYMSVGVMKDKKTAIISCSQRGKRKKKKRWKEEKEEKKGRKRREKREERREEREEKERERRKEMDFKKNRPTQSVPPPLIFHYKRCSVSTPTQSSLILPKSPIIDRSISFFVKRPHRRKVRWKYRSHEWDVRARSRTSLHHFAAGKSAPLHFRERFIMNQSGLIRFVEKKNSMTQFKNSATVYDSIQ